LEALLEFKGGRKKERKKEEEEAGFCGE